MATNESSTESRKDEDSGTSETLGNKADSYINVN